MTEDRFNEITGRYADLRIAVIGDFCLDRYLEIDPARRESSIETGLEVHNVTRIRSQPGGAGTILNNLVALGVGRIFAVGFCGDDGEGYELKRALQQQPGVDLRSFVQSNERHTFTYTKPLVCEAGKTPRELNRLDIKNWTSTPGNLESAFIASIRTLAAEVDTIIVLDQVDEADTGVITARVREALGEIGEANPRLPILVDSRRGLKEWPPLIYKMNARELTALQRSDTEPASQIKQLATTVGRPVFVTLAENGMLGATSSGEVHHHPCFPIRGEIDVVGAGDSVMANLASALAAQATIPEALALASAAASIVVHQLGTTGSANVTQLRELLGQFDSVTT